MMSLWSRTTRRISVCVVSLLASASFVSSAGALCSQPVSEGEEPTLQDCIYIARASIGAVSCSDCVCDTDGSGDLRLRDALRCLRFVVGSDVTLDCPPCDGSTTTTQPTCASCNDALIGLAQPDDLCEDSRLLYDTAADCPCDQCEAECGSFVCGPVAPTGAVTGASPSVLCWSCLRDQCRQAFVDCAED